MGRPGAIGWHSRMPPCPPQQNRNRLSQLPTGELGEMELTWQEIMSITELQVSMGWALAWPVAESRRAMGNTGGREDTGWGYRPLSSCFAYISLYHPLLYSSLLSSSHLIRFSLPALPIFPHYHPSPLATNFFPPGSRALVKGPQKGEIDCAGVLSS